MPRGTKRKIETPSEEERAPKRIKLDLKYDAREENQLPDEIVLQLLRQLDRADFVPSTMTCRQWYRLGQREEFEWTFVAEVEAKEDANGYYLQRLKKPPKYPEPLEKEQEITELKNWQADPLHLGIPVRIESKKVFLGTQLWLFDAQDNLIAIAKSDYTNEFDFSDKNNKDLWKYTIEPLPVSDEKKNKWPVQKRLWKVNLYINLKVLDWMVLEKIHEAVPNQKTLLQAIHIEWWETSATEHIRMKGIQSYINRPLKSTVPQKQPSGFNEGINLYKYQLDAVTWMKSVEDHIGQDVIYTSVIHWKGSAVYFDPVNEKIIHPRDLHQHIRKEQIRGGILADDVGLGKTFEVLGLVLAAPPKSEIEPHPVLIDSKATLIMCPEHISKQWHDEITRATNLKVLLVSDVEALLPCTYEDFISKYDVIVCSYDIFISPKYACLPRNRVNTKMTKKERNTNVKQALEKLKKTKNLSNVTAPIIEHFFFHRVVFDEGHQSKTHFAMCYESLDLSKNVWGHSRWFVSATPFEDFSTERYEVLQFLCPKEGSKCLATEYLYELIFKDYFWRNTKESVKDELVVPATVDDVHYIEFTPIERAIYFTDKYNSRKSSAPYKSCCTFLYEQGVKAAAQETLKKTQKKIRSFTDDMNFNAQELNETRQKHQLEKNEIKKKGLEILLEKINRRAAYYQTAINTFQNATEILEQEIPKLPKKRLQTMMNEDKDLTSVLQYFGSKVAGMLTYLQKLFEEKPDSRVIIFSLHHRNYLETLLNEFDIPTTSVRGNVHDKVQAIEDFKKEMAPFKVIMMNSEHNSAGSNMIEASHVLLLDPPEDDQESFETQAIGRAYRQGQTKQITVARILFKDSHEHSEYLKKNNMPTDDLIEYNPETWKPHQDEDKTHTNTNRIAKLSKSGSFVGITAAELKQSLEIQNNTNEHKEDEEEKTKDNAEDSTNNNDDAPEESTEKKAPKRTRRTTKKK